MLTVRTGRLATRSQSWFCSCKHVFDPSKTELLFFGTSFDLNKCSHIDSFESDLHPLQSVRACSHDITPENSRHSMIVLIKFATLIRSIHKLIILDLAFKSTFLPLITNWLRLLQLVM